MTLRPPSRGGHLSWNQATYIHDASRTPPSIVLGLHFWILSRPSFIRHRVLLEPRGSRSPTLASSGISSPSGLSAIPTDSVPQSGTGEFNIRPKTVYFLVISKLSSKVYLCLLSRLASVTGRPNPTSRRKPDRDVGASKSPNICASPYVSSPDHPKEGETSTIPLCGFAVDSLVAARPV